MNSNQTANSLNNYDFNTHPRRHARSYTDKYQIDPRLSNRYSAWITNPTVQPDEKTEMGVPIPSELNTEFSKEYEEENQL